MLHTRRQANFLHQVDDLLGANVHHAFADGIALPDGITTKPSGLCVRCNPPLPQDDHCLLHDVGNVALFSLKRCPDVDHETGHHCPKCGPGPAPAPWQPQLDQEVP